MRVPDLSWLIENKGKGIRNRNGAVTGEEWSSKKSPPTVATIWELSQRVFILMRMIQEMGKVDDAGSGAGRDFWSDDLESSLDLLSVYTHSLGDVSNFTASNLSMLWQLPNLHFQLKPLPEFQACTTNHLPLNIQQKPQTEMSIPKPLALPSKQYFNPSGCSGPKPRSHSWFTSFFHNLHPIPHKSYQLNIKK